MESRKGKRIAGTCYIKVDGVQLDVAGSVTVSISKVEKEGLSGLSGPVGYTEKPRVPSIEVEAFLTKKFPMDKLEEMDGGTVTAELANGKTAVLSGAWLKGPIEASAGDGTTTLTFEGLTGEWI